MRVDDVLRGDLCSGCGLCASIAGPDRAAMRLDQRGYLRPHFFVEPTEAQHRLIDASCPGGRLDRAKGSGGDPVWGPIRLLNSAHATDEDLRHRASSGGALSALLQDVLRRGDADYVLHVGADDRTSWLNEVTPSFDPTQVAAKAGSRYSPSSPLADVVQRLDGPERFVIVAKPCDIAGLRMYARQDPRVSEKVVAMVSFMCGGIPSEAGVMELLERMGVRPEEVASFRFRGQGWPGRATATLKDGQERSLSYAEAWGDVLQRHVQRRCKICPDGMGAFADVVCADAWHIDEDGAPSFEEHPGRSVVIARTATGEALVRAAATSGAIVLGPLELEEVQRMQPHQARRTRLTLSRVLAMAFLGRRFPRYRGMDLFAAARRAGLTANLRSLLGTMRRILLRRL